MNPILRVALVGAAFLLASVSRPQEAEKSAPATEQQQNEDTQTMVCRCLADGDFDTLEAMATRFRDQKSVVSWGAWKLYYFYEGIYQDAKFFNYKDRAKCVSTLEQWKKAKPKSVTPRVFLSKIYVDMAWESRGGGWASEVTEEGWGGFHDYLEKAGDELKAAEELNPNDPAVYEIEVVVGMGLGLSGAEMAKIDAKARKIDPPYLGYYYRRMVSLLPRWGGSRGDVEALAAKAADATREKYGDFLYAFLANASREWTDEDVCVEFGFQWPRVQKGFQDWIARIQDPFWHVQSFCRMACEKGDKETAATLFKSDKFGAEPDTSIWGGERACAAWKDWALGNGPSPNSPLTAAIRKGDLAAITRELDAGKDVNAIAPSGDTLLCLAVESKNDDVVELLLKRGADPSIPRESDLSCPLQMATRSHKTAMVKSILNHTTVFEPKDEDKWQPLVLAAFYGYEDVVKVLLDHKGTDINGTDRYLATALHRAAGNHRPEIVRMLLEGGADMNPLDRNHAPPILRAKQKGDKESESAIIDHAQKILAEIGARLKSDGDINAFTSDHKTPLLVAVEAQQRDLIETLLRRGADPNRAAGSGALPLATAASHGYSEAIPLLLEKGADPNGFQGINTALHLALLHGNPEVVKALLKSSRIELLADRKSQYTPLHIAASMGDADSLRLLLQNKKAVINARDAFQRTPLAVAAGQNRADAVRALLAAGADRSIPDHKRRTPLDLARQRKATDVIPLLEGLANTKKETTP